MKATKSNLTQNRAAKPVPEGFHTVTPFIVVNGAEKFIDLVKKAFGAEVTFLTKSDEGHVRHATIRIGNSMIMVADADERSEPTRSTLYLYVEDVDSVYKQAVNAGTTSLREPTDEFYGDRSSGVRDAWGNQWWIGTHIEDVSDDELKRRMEKMSREPA